MRFPNIQTHLENGLESVDPDDAAFLNRKSLDFMFIEPVITVKVGGDNFKILTQTGTAIKLSSTSIKYKSFLLQLGVAFAVDLKRKSWRSWSKPRLINI